MKKQLQAAVAAILVVGSLSLHAQTGTAAPATTTKKTKQAKAVTAVKVEESQDAKAIRELQEKMAAQQAQIDALMQQNAAKDAALSAAQNAAASAQSQAASASAQAQSASSSVQANTDAVTAVKSDVTDLKNANAGLATTINDAKKDLNDKIDSPSAIHYKGVTITPVAFFAAEGVWRQHSVNSDINTPFNSIPVPGAVEGHISELNFSGRQSRLGGLFEGNAGSFKLSGYFEADFLSSGTTSNNNQSNSYTLRQRQIWGKAETTGGFAITGGQMWSLVAEDGTSTNNRTEKLPNAIDPSIRSVSAGSVNLPSASSSAGAIQRPVPLLRPSLSSRRRSPASPRPRQPRARCQPTSSSRAPGPAGDSTTRTAGPMPTTSPPT